MQQSGAAAGTGGQGAGGFLVPVEVRPCTDAPGKGHGVFSLAPVAAGAIMWRPGLVTKLAPDEVAAKLQSMTPEDAHTFLRQAFVTAEDPGHLCVNPTDLGRFMNHSAAANTVAGLAGGAATRDIGAGEELTCDYGKGLACPGWYQALCDTYGVLSTADVAAKFS